MVLMIYELTYRLKEAEVQIEEGQENESRPHRAERRSEWVDMVSDINMQLGIKCGLDGNLSALIVDGKPGRLSLLVACEMEKVTERECQKYLKDTLFKACDRFEEISFGTSKEISPSDVRLYLNKASRVELINGRAWFMSELGMEWAEDHHPFPFELTEKCVTGSLTYKQALKEAEELMADDSLIEELERIYSADNARKFYGHPVHYKISLSDIDIAYSICELLIRALKTNNRLVGSRMETIHDIDDHFFTSDSNDDFFDTSKGNAVVIDMSGEAGDLGNYASEYEEFTNYIEKQIKKHRINTLFIFIENTSSPGFSRSLITKAKDYMDIVEIKEGAGNYERAKRFFSTLAAKNSIKMTDDTFDKVMSKQQLYTMSEICEGYDNWYRGKLKNETYKAYKTCEMLRINEKTKHSEPYTELQKMVGLTDIKTLVDQIIASAKMMKIRSKMGLNADKASMHMVFTGNPGSAKTTVARLLAQILKKEGVLGNGKFVEVGRADLVARYVGWTAKTVREKFRDASGGILFIDEAYSLLEEENLFGTEAINTIVQEMENHRDEVIVIFAGYPEKMKEFLNKNEGLRSRIAFHLNFPDYNAGEMMEILKLLVENKGYCLAKGVEPVCMDIFREACSHEEFGNGRFARNLLEQAEMRQSQRLFKEKSGKKLTKAQLKELKAEDFETNASQQYKEKKRKIGFAG